MDDKWSNDYCVAEFKDFQASAMAVDCVGSLALLAGRKNLAFVNLNESKKTTVKVTRQSKWDIICVQFNKHSSHAQRFVTACNQRLDVFDFRDATTSTLCSIKAHSRAVSDVDWSPFDVNIIASSSIDTFTYFWDVRDWKKPVKSFQSVSGVGQVKWNRVTNNLFATTHDGDVRIWDPRKGNAPLQYISAHLSKIHGLDWNETDQHKLVTSSQDSTIRFWDFKNPRISETIINSGNPVWRAKYTPFGEGVVSVIVPQLRRGESSLYLWHKANYQAPVHTFSGHKDVVLDFQFRKKSDDDHNHSLITWSKDQSLRIWKVDPAIQRLVGHDIDDLPDLPTGLSSSSGRLVSNLRPIDNIIGTYIESSSNKDLSLQNGSVHGDESSQMGQTLEQELRDVTSRLQNVKLTKVDGKQRCCQASIVRGKHFIDLDLVLPDKYPVNTPPVASLRNSNLSQELEKQLLQVFDETSSRYVKQNSKCLEGAFTQMIFFLDKHLSSSSLKDMGGDDLRRPDKKFVVDKVKTGQAMYFSGGYQDNPVPFPRTCGAQFCANDRLVVFGVPASFKKMYEENETTPRSLAELVSYTTSQAQRLRNPTPSLYIMFASPPAAVVEAVSISNWFIEKHSKSRQRQGHHRLPHSRSVDLRREKEKEVDKHVKKRQKVSLIKIYEAQGLFPVNRFLAENYKLDVSDMMATCEHNSRVAKEIGRTDLVQLWTIVSQTSHQSLSHDSKLNSWSPWAFHPFGRNLIQKLLSHYSAYQDVQTLAMICCIFWESDKPTTDGNPPQLHRETSQQSVDYSSGNSYFCEDFEACLWRQQHLNGSYHPLYTSRKPTLQAMGEVASQPNLMEVFKAAVLKGKRSMSWSESETYDGFKILEGSRDVQDSESSKQRRQDNDNCRMLDPEKRGQYEQMKRAYADILYNWGLLNQRSQLLKHTEAIDNKSNNVSFSVKCHNCQENSKDVQCSHCCFPTLQCAICHLPVKGSANMCLTCGHGGHRVHLMEWFSTQSVCPTGCGCKCLEENSS